MQIIFENKNERSSDRRKNSVNVVIYIGRISRCVEKKCIGESRVRKLGI